MPHNFFSTNIITDTPRISSELSHGGSLGKEGRENRHFREFLQQDYRRYFQIGGITIQVDSDLSFSDTTFNQKFESFRADGPGPDTIHLHHHFSIPQFAEMILGKEVYRRAPWAIYQDEGKWVYRGIPPDGADFPLHRFAIFSKDHASGDIYNDGQAMFQKGDLYSLTMFPTDQILLARLLADREGCLLHSCGAVMNEKGFLFVGHSDAGKTTTARLIEPYSEILCDDRNIVRRHDDGWKVYGTWSHGDLATVSSRSAPLHAILFLEQSGVNRIKRIDDYGEIIRRLLVTVIRPLATVEWWEKTLTILQKLAHEVPCYRMEFDRSGVIVEELQRL